MPLSPLAQTHARHFFGRLLLATFLLMTVYKATAFAQMGGIDGDPGDPGTGGKNTIQGTIFLASGQRLDRRVKVKLTGLAGAEQFQMSDDSGSFSFRRLQGGKYTLVIDAGKEFEIATESVDIIDPPTQKR